MPKRTQIQIFGQIERTLQLSIDIAPLQQGTHSAHSRKWLLAGEAVRLARELTGLDFTCGVIARIGNDEPGRNIASRLRRDAIDTGMVQKDLPFETTLTVQVLSPQQRLEFRSPATPRPVVKTGLAPGLKSIRHLHICEDALASQPQRVLEFALRNARNSRATTSLQLNAVQAATELDSSASKLLSRIDVLFTRSRVVRSLTGRSRLAEAVEELLGLGTASVFVDLDSGGSRVYDSETAVRVPAFVATNREEPREHVRLVATFLAGRLLGGSLGAAATLAEAGRSLADERTGRPDRHAIRRRIGTARTDPRFRKLISWLREAERLMSSRRAPKRSSSRR